MASTACEGHVDGPGGLSFLSLETLDVRTVAPEFTNNSCSSAPSFLFSSISLSAPHTPFSSSTLPSAVTSHPSSFFLLPLPLPLPRLWLHLTG